MDDHEAAVEPGTDSDQAPSQHRRGRRDLLIGGGALAALLVLVGVGVLAILQTEEQTSAGTADGTMPLLGWSEGSSVVFEFRAGIYYAGTWWPPESGKGDQGVTVQVYRTGSFPEPPGTEEEATVGGQPARLVRSPSGAGSSVEGLSRLLWEPSEGWSAQLSVLPSRNVTRPLDTATKDELLTRAASGVRPIAPEAFGRVADRDDDPVRASSTLIFADGDGRSIVRSRNFSGTTDIALEPMSDRSQVTELCVSEDFDQRSRREGRAVTVRGTQGVASDVHPPVLDQTTTPSFDPYISPNGRRSVEWSEGDLVYQLGVDASVSVEEAVAIADAMRTPSPAEWGQLFVVTQPPYQGGRYYC